MIEGVDVIGKLMNVIRKEKPRFYSVSKRLNQSVRLSRIQFLESPARKLSEWSPRPILSSKEDDTPSGKEESTLRTTQRHLPRQ